MPDLQATLVAMKREGLISDAVASAILDRSRDAADRFGKYRLDAKLGEGGMGEVWKAWQTDLGRWVALKFVKGADPEAVARFIREAQTSAKLSHPNIVSIHEAGELEGRHYIAMDYIDGDDLKKRRVGTKQALTLIRDAADAVHHAHRQGVVHRDLKPANLMLDGEGRVRVMDFGLAKSEAAPGLSISGTVVGTPHYMPPEQARGMPVDARSDVYSLGATLYELITGHPPFEGENVMDVLRKVETEEATTPRTLNPMLDRDVETIIHKAMEKEPSKRYPSAKALAEDIARQLRGEPISARPLSRVGRLTKRVKRNPIPWALAAIIVFGLIGLIGTAVASRLLRESKRRGATATAESALQRGAWADAFSAANDGLRVASDDPKLVKLRGVADQMLRHDRAVAGGTAKVIEPPELPTYAPASQREKIWEAEQKNREAELSALAEEENALQAARTAFSLDETIRATARAVAEICLTKYERALTQRRHEEAEWWRRQTLEFGKDEYRARLEKPGTIVPTATSTGATAYLFRYEEVRGRLFPVPWRMKSGVEVPGVDALPWDSTGEEKKRVRDGTAYPLTFGASSAVTFPASLSPGSYLVVYRMEGYAEARVPVLLGRGERIEAKVEFVKPDEIPPGFVYVPAGTFIAGNDPEAEDYMEEGRTKQSDLRPDVPGFFIQKFSVTCGEYLEYLRDASWHGGKAKTAQERWPRGTPEGGYHNIEAWSADEPVVGISLDDAADYAKWYTTKHGNGQWTFRLPEEDEWEKAARGTDGRAYPWGQMHDPAFSAMAASRENSTSARRSVMERIGLFPADESPYGMRDAAGVVQTWVKTESKTGMTFFVKGGSWNKLAPGCRSATRDAVFPIDVFGDTGLRLAASRSAKPPDKDF